MPEQIIPQVKMSNPEKFSFREEALSLIKSGDDSRIFTDASTGEKFYKLDTAGAERQKLTALILKGAVNVSDVVKVGDSFYSHVQDFDKLESKEDKAVVEAQVDMFLLSTLFRDEDHRYSADINDRNSVSGPVEHQNIMIDVSANKFNVFDFHQVKFSHLIRNVVSIESINNNIEYAKVELARRITTFNLNKEDVYKVLSSKIQILLILFSEQHKEGFNKTIDRSGVNFTNEQKDIFFSNMKVLLEALKKSLQ